MLRKNIYPFKSMEQNFKGKRNKKAKQKQSTATEVDEHSKSTETPAQNIKEEYVEPVKESPLLPEQKKIDFKRKVYVAPLTTVGNLPFRRLMKQTGADITCGEMAMATNLLKAQQSEWALLRRHKSEDCFGVQIAGGFPDQMSRVCELITRETDVDFIDINMGCPIDLVCQQGAGAALMNRPPRIMEVVSSSLTGIELGASAVAQIGRVTPGLTVKLRTGWSEKQPTAHKLIRKIQGIRASSVYMNASVVQDYRLRATQYVDAVTIHGRSRLQRYTRNADWDYVFQCADEQDPEQPQIPFIGGGDVLSFEEFDEHLKNGKLETCMIARGALIKPWLPIEIKERRHFDISASERFDLLKDFVRFGLEHWGSDQKGINRTRRYLLEWQSFLCRYIPVGLLERLPQRINDRPAPYVSNCSLIFLFFGEDLFVSFLYI
jgi:tRNA-dihydrouridine synthase 3